MIPSTGAYDDSTVISNLHTNSKAVYKPSYKNYHIRCANDATLQIVSVFAIGYAEHFLAESGGDQSLTNSNSNFGAKSLVSKGFKRNAFNQDNTGYITHIIPPKEIPLTESAVEFESLDVLKTLPSGYSAIGVGSTANLYLYGKTNEEAPPENVIEGYRFGARTNDSLKILVSSGTVTEYSSRIVMPLLRIVLRKYLPLIKVLLVLIVLVIVVMVVIQIQLLLIEHMLLSMVNQ